MVERVSIVFRPPICRIGAIDIDPAGELFHLAFERDGPAAVPLANFHAEQVAFPPGGFGGVRMRAPSGDRNRIAAAKQQQVAVGDAMLRLRERQESCVVE